MFKNRLHIHTGDIEHSLQQDFINEGRVVAGQHILEQVLTDYHGPVAVRLWNGDLVHGKADAPCTMVIEQPAVLRDLVLCRDLDRLGESYLIGEINVVGNTEYLFGLIAYLQKLKLPWSTRLRLARNALHLPRHRIAVPDAVCAGSTARDNSQESIAHHYDVSNAFYQLWLDPEMVYSCAYFCDDNQSLASAQHDKLDYICHKLRLVPGQTMLDIGCGWGALICWAARNYSVKAHGITLSEEQYHYTAERVRNEGLQDQVTVELRDYRELPADVCYDRVVSVGMFEHIGVANFPVYFRTVMRVLKPGGLFLNHGITNDTGWEDTEISRFITRYIFPDGELARISDVVNAMEQAGFEILDVEGLRRHYVLTLRRWVQALESKQDEVIRVSSEVVYRLWRLYMAGAAYYFDEGSSNIYQVLAGHGRQPLCTPLRRTAL